MKLGTLSIDGTTAAVLIDSDTAARIEGFADVGELLAAGERGVEAALTAQREADRSPFEIEDLRRPILMPGAIICVGLNFRHHITEMGRDLPTHPTLFSKLARSLTDPFADIELSDASGETDYEGEVAIVIGAGGREIPVESAGSAIAGYTLMNDVSMRDWQYRTLQWFAGKSFEASTPVGPYVVTGDEFDLSSAEIDVLVNGEPRQHASLSDLMFDPAALVADISSFTTLRPGDLIATGTPGGVGHALDPPRHLDDGDVVEVVVDGLGALRNRFVRR